MEHLSEKQRKRTVNPRSSISNDSSPASLYGNQAMLNLCHSQQPIQRYYEDGGYRVSDDKSLVTYASDPQKFAASAAKLGEANRVLAQNQSQIQLISLGALAGENKVAISASYNGRQYKQMVATSDCGEFSHLVTGEQNLHGRYQNMGVPQNTGPSLEGNPKNYRTEVLDRLSSFLLNDASYAFIDAVLIESRGYLSSIAASCKNLQWLLNANKANIVIESQSAVLYLDPLSHPTLNPEEALELLGQSIFARRIVWNQYFSRYPNALPHPTLLTALSQSPTLAKEFGVNQFAAPETGAGFVTISDENPVPNAPFIWDYHWSGVVMESDNKADHVVIENYASLICDPLNPEQRIPEINNEWNFEMHGTLKPLQSFHEHHRASGQHGQAPLTLAVKSG